MLSFEGVIELPFWKSLIYLIIAVKKVAAEGEMKLVFADMLVHVSK